VPGMILQSDNIDPDILIQGLQNELAQFGCLRVDVPFMLSTDKPGESDVQTQSPKAITGVANIEEISRTGILVKIDGLDLTYFRRNPVLLANHYQIVPDTLVPAVLGTVGRITKTEGILQFSGLNFDKESSLAQEWKRRVEAELVRMVSIGFFPIEAEWAERTTGKGEKKRTQRYLEFTTSELVELSLCVIGANRGAFITLPGKHGQSGAPELLDRVEALQREIAELRSVIDGTEPEDESYGDSSFPDAAFIVERGAPKEGGKTPQKYRHLPHHTKGVKSPTENTTIDLPHLRNALARVNQVKPVQESAESYRKRATAHLRSHARVVLKTRESAMESLLALRSLLDAPSQVGRAAELAARFRKETQVA
jgi:hypothetical protein